VWVSVRMRVNSGGLGAEFWSFWGSSGLLSSSRLWRMLRREGIVHGSLWWEECMRVGGYRYISCIGVKMKIEYRCTCTVDVRTKLETIKW
jgi:hypothetical protein